MKRRRIRRLLRLRGSTARDAVDEVDDEVRLHVELRAADLMRQGVDEASARLQAEALFARDADTLRALYESALERDEHMRMRERFESLLQDVRYAARGLFRDPLLTTFMVAALALGIGANLTSFSLVDRLLVRAPAHVVDADRVVRLYGRVEREAVAPNTSSWIPYGVFHALYEDMTTFGAVGAYRVQDRHIGSGADARSLRVGQVLGAFFPLLGVKPLAGRLFADGDDAATAGAEAVISESIWRTAYGGAPDVLGRTILVDDAPHPIVGVAPSGFVGTEARRVDVWVLGNTTRANTQNWHIVGRLAATVERDAASAEATAIHARGTVDSPAWFRDAHIFAAPLSYGDQGTEPLEATMARWLAVVTIMILLIMLANLISVLLVRLARRRRELAIRLSLGSGRRRVIRLVALEGVLLAVAGGIASLFVARLTEPIVRGALFGSDAGWTFSLADTRLLLAAVAVVLFTAVCVGLLPALHTGGGQLAVALRSAPQVGGSSSRVRAGLTILQAALSVVLLVGAGLFLRSLANVAALDLGVDRDRVITAEAVLPPPQSFDRAAFDELFRFERDLYRRLEEVAGGVRGVERVAVSIGLPLDGGSFSADVWVPGRDSIPTLPGGGPHVSTITPGYFETVGTRLLYGRAFNERDREGSEPVIIINETMAGAIWNGRDALDQCVHIGRLTNPCARIVGIVEDVHRIGLREQPSLQYYLPLGQQNMFGGAKLVIRTSSSASLSLAALREAIVQADPAVRAVDIQPLSTSLDGEMRPLRLGIVTFGMSGALALIVAVLGLYSIMSYLVAWRTHEIGVRMALGASRSSVVVLVLRNGVTLAAIGVAAGLILAVIGGRWLQPHLFDTSANDAGVISAVAAALLLTALVAGWIPARRATHISPTQALRAE